MKACLPRVACALLASWAISAAAQQSLIPAQSEIAFTSTQMGVPVQGKFRKFDAHIAFDPSRPEASKIAFSIDIASVSFGVAELETEVAKAAWFDTKRFPQATFQSIAVKEAGPGRFDVAGKLTIKGGVRQVIVPVAVAQTAAGTTATGAFAIKRLDHGIGDGEWKDTGLVSNEVQIRFRLVLASISGK